jgi:hypothetical protein
MGAQAICGPCCQASTAEAGKVRAVCTGGAAAPEPVVPASEGPETWQDVVGVNDRAVTPAGGNGDPAAGAGAQQLAALTASGSAQGSSRDEWGAPRFVVDRVMSARDGRGAWPVFLFRP